MKVEVHEEMHEESVVLPGRREDQTCQTIPLGKDGIEVVLTREHHHWVFSLQLLSVSFYAKCKARDQQKQHHLGEKCRILDPGPDLPNQKVPYNETPVRFLHIVKVTKG